MNLKIKFEKLNNKLIRYGLVGVANTFIGLAATYWCLYFYNLNILIANAVGYGIGLILSFFLNRYWTFKYKIINNLLLLRYIIMAVIAYISNLIVVLLGIYVNNINPYILQIMGMMTYTFIMFIGCQKFVFIAYSK